MGGTVRIRVARLGPLKQAGLLDVCLMFIAGLADQRYQGGRASYLDVLTSQRSLFDSELALAKTRQSQLVSMVQLYKALGGGWSADKPDGNLPDPRSLKASGK